MGRTRAPHGSRPRLPGRVGAGPRGSDRSRKSRAHSLPPRRSLCLPPLPQFSPSGVRVLLAFLSPRRLASRPERRRPWRRHAHKPTRPRLRQPGARQACRRVRRSAFWRPRSRCRDRLTRRRWESERMTASGPPHAPSDLLPVRIDVVQRDVHPVWEISGRVFTATKGADLSALAEGVDRLARDAEERSSASRRHHAAFELVEQPRQLLVPAFSLRSSHCQTVVTRSLSKPLRTHFRPLDRPSGCGARDHDPVLRRDGHR